MLGRACVSLLIAFPILYLVTISPDVNPYLLFVVASLIPFTIFGIILFSIIDPVCLKLGLYDSVIIQNLNEPFFEDLLTNNSTDLQ